MHSGTIRSFRTWHWIIVSQTLVWSQKCGEVWDSWLSQKPLYLNWLEPVQAWAFQIFWAHICRIMQICVKIYYALLCCNYIRKHWVRTSCACMCVCVRAFETCEPPVNQYPHNNHSNRYFQISRVKRGNRTKLRYRWYIDWYRLVYIYTGWYRWYSMSLSSIVKL